jgi:hypothetical protein
MVGLMRNFFAITEALVGIVSLSLGIYEYHIGDSRALGTCIFGIAWLVLSAWGYFLTDWENGWDGRHDAAWVLEWRKNRKDR